MQALQAGQTDAQLLRQFGARKVFARDARAGQFLCVGVTSFGGLHARESGTQGPVRSRLPVLEKVNRGPFSAKKLNVYAGARADVESGPRFGCGPFQGCRIGPGTPIFSWR